MENEPGGGTLVELKDGRVFAVEDGTPEFTVKYCLGIEVTQRPFKYAVMGSYEKAGKTYAFVDNHPEILEQLLELKN